jgi:hypothetical protein
MTSPPEVLPHVDAVQAALESIPGLTVYLGGAPTDAGWLPPDKYAVIYPEPGEAVRESLADKRTDFVSVMQVTCVGGDPVRAPVGGRQGAAGPEQSAVGGGPYSVAAGGHGRASGAA